MDKINRNIIEQVSQANSLSSEEIELLLHKNVYPDKDKWMKFLRIFVLGIGVAFLSAGVMFFFAYNWDVLHKFVKLGMMQGVIVIFVIVAFLTKTKMVKDIVLAAATFMVGILFAVFGQIYQTGANAYDFFLGWTICVTLWVFVSNFSVQWLLYLVLINTTIIMYEQQVAYDWSEMYLYGILLMFNVLTLVFFEGLQFAKKINVPRWFLNVLLLVVTGLVTSVLVVVIVSYKPDVEEVTFTILLSLIVLIGGFVYGALQRKLLYIGLMSTSIIVVVVTLMLDGEELFFLSGMFVVASVSLLVKIIVELQKTWDNEKS